LPYILIIRIFVFMRQPVLTPVPPGERIQALDQLRGVAVLGILIMNIQHFSMPASAYINPTAYGDLTGANRWVWILSQMLASGKFLSIFSMLFGAGILLFTERAGIKGLNPARLHYRRMGWLLLFGLMHAYLLWTGDILVSYSLCGMLVFLLRDLRPPVQLRLAIAFFLVPVFWDLFSAWTMPVWPEGTLRSAMESWAPGKTVIRHQIQVYRSGWLDQMELRIPDSLFIQTRYFLMQPLWRVTSLMLLGMALYRQNVLSGLRSSRYYTRMMLTGLGTGYALSGLGVYLNFRHQWTLEYSMFQGSQFNYVGSVFTALGYVGGIMLINRSDGFNRAKRGLAAVGRMAFSNYILMTLTCTFLFYGHGLGLFGQVERKLQILMVPAIWILMILFSMAWLKRFRFGPLERIWRGLTYRNWS
jgi:uncharacterized protein